MELTEPYLYLILEFLATRGYGAATERLEKAAELLRETWKFLPFMHRVADVEHYLATALFSVPSRSEASWETLNQRLLELDPRQAFALIARDFENWDYRHVAAALRISRRELSEVLVTVRCRLLEIDLDSLEPSAAACVRRLSLDLDGQQRAREKHRICQQIITLPQAREFKSEWLELRCGLIEYRQQVRMADEERKDFLRAAVSGLSTAQMIQVPMLERFASRLPFRPSFAASS